MTYKPLFPVRKAHSPYRVVDTGKAGSSRFHVVKRKTGKVLARAATRQKAGLYIAFAEKKITTGRAKSLNIQPETLEIGDWSTMRFVEILRLLGIRNVEADDKAVEDKKSEVFRKGLNFVGLTKAEEPPKPVVPPKEHANSARAANIGEVHYWKTGPHKKIAPNEWVPVSEGEAKHAKKESRPAQRINDPDHEWGNDLDNRNKDGTVTLYHRTSEDGAKGIVESGKFESKMNTGEAYFSTRDHGEVSGYGDHVIAVDVDPGFVSLNDEFAGGEAHVTVDQRNQRAFKNMRVLEGGGLEPKISQSKGSRTIGDKEITTNTFTTDGGKLNVWENSPGAQGAHSVTDFVVDEDKRGQGIGSKLVDALVAEYPDKEISAQVSSAASLKVFHSKGFRGFNNEDGSFEEHLEEWESEGRSLNVRLHPATKQEEEPHKALTRAFRNLSGLWRSKNNKPKV